MAELKEKQHPTAENDKLAKGAQSGEQDKPDNERVKTVTPDNDNGEPGAPESEGNKAKSK